MVMSLTYVCGNNAFTVTDLDDSIALRRDLNSGFATTMVKLLTVGGGDEMHPGRSNLISFHR